MSGKSKKNIYKMALSVEITKRQHTKLKRVFGLRGSLTACKSETGIAVSTIRNLLFSRRAAEDTIEKLSQYLGYDLELEQDKIPA